ncbi:MAG: restriction endonuclease subunit S, partial [Prevotella sp.]
MADNNNNKILNVPPLRFPEFTDEWEKQCLGNLGTTIIGLTYKPSDVTNDGSGIIVFRSSNIQKGIIDYSDLVRVSKKIKSNLFTQEDDILICARNGSAKLIGKNAILEKSDANKTFGAFMMIYRSQQNRFVKQLLETRRYVTQISENLGARINQVTTSDFNGFEFFFPKTDEEKKKIAIFLRLIDKRIAVQNKIIEDLKKLKSAIIEKLF